MTPRDGLLLLAKPPGLTSFTALNAVKKKLDTKKVGHTGTLDKFAEGLLIALSGRYTRLAPFISGMDKRYSCVFEFGTETASLDPEGGVVKTAPLPEEESLRAQIRRFTGPLMQRPPDFSAIHVEGKRAYQMALRGEELKLQERPITIYSFEVESWQPPFLSCSVHCSKGTYIRALARDLGRAVSSCAYVKVLRRTQVGPFHLAGAVAPGDFDPESSLKRGRDFLEKLFSEQPLTLKDQCIGAVRAGKPLCDDFFEPSGEDFPAGDRAVFTKNGELAAVISGDGKRYTYRFVCL
ncbi:MAG: tRNA pseudouridine(55) synthase TruB [Spirochaetales bacterium]|jgi:tRNA pseudouridine55 synthase|nr:tRNA pseudouridine(55) synthase TruB [Spirochaetales bacterium]